MATSTVEERSRSPLSRARGRTPSKARTPFGDLALVARSIVEEARGVDSWAGERARYRADNVAFAREVLGETLWHRQIEILEAVRDHKRVAVRSGHKVGKSRTAAIVALWFYSCFDDARVVMSSTTSRQVDQILWRELKKLHARARKPIEGDIGALARTGLKSSDFREIVGFTAREAEAVAGISGSNLLYLIDEASGVGDPIFEAIEGNRMGGARIVLFSNPTKTEGEFFEAFHSKAYHRIQVSSEETPNYVEGRQVIPGLANREIIEEKREEWGSLDAEGKFVPGPLYKVRVLGEFVMNESGKVLSLHDIGEAEKRWEEVPASGRLHIGVDPAGPTIGGDESGFAVRRGLKVIAIRAIAGLTEDALVATVLDLLKEYRRPRDPVPVVCVDADGDIGSAVLGRLRAHSELHPTAFEVVGVKGSHRTLRHSKYDRVRDELWASLRRFIVEEGGAIPEDVKLAKELHAPSFLEFLGKTKITPKAELRQMLGRSPDRGDAVALSVWTPAYLAVEDDGAGVEATPDPAGAAPLAGPTPSKEADEDDDFDPYTGGPITPYG